LLGTLMLIGATMLAGHPARYGAAQVLAVGTAALAMFDATGQLLAVPAAAVAGTSGVMAGPAATGLLMLSVGLLLSQPDRGAVRVALDPGPAGLTVRRYVPAMVVVPLALSWPIWQGVTAGVYPPALGAALLATLSALAAAGLMLFASTRPSVRFEPGVAGPVPAVPQDTESQPPRTIADAPIPMVVHDGETIVDMNRAWSEIAGADRKGLTTLTAWVSRVQPDRVEDLPAFRSRLAAATDTIHEGEQTVRTPEGAERIYLHLSGGFALHKPVDFLSDS
jgi:PAS domain-containing protein